MKTLTLFILLFNTAWAQSLKVSQKECTPTDVRDHHPHLKEHFSTPQDQDSVGWCYAYAAADLLSVEAGEPVSAIHVSAIYNKQVTRRPVLKFGYKVRDLIIEPRFEEVYVGGFMTDALKDAIKAKKVCSDKNLPYYSIYSVEASDLIKSIEAVKKSYKEASISEAKACEMLDTRLGISMLGVFADRDKVLKSLLNDEMNAAFENLIRENCKERMITLRDMKVKELSMPPKSYDRNIGPSYDKEIKNYLKQVNNVLNSGKPLSISYNVKHISVKNGGHASTVMARRWNNGRCEYKIRNTWGHSCALYKKNVECNESEGTYWVNDELFFKMAKGLAFVDG